MKVQNLNTRLSFLLLVIFLSGGCFGVPKAPKVEKVGKKETVSWWKAKVKTAETALDIAKTGLKQAKISRVQRIMAWVIGLALLVVVACVVVFFTIPGMKRWCIGLGISGLVVAAFALLLSWVAPYLLWVVLGIVLIGLIVVLTSFRKESKALAQVVKGVNVIKSRASGYREVFNNILSRASKKRVKIHKSAQGI